MIASGSICYTAQRIFTWVHYFAQHKSTLSNL